MAGGALSRSAILAILSLVLPAPGFSGQGNKTKREEPASGLTTFKAPVGVVVVNATVTDKAGRTIGDLTEQDFRVYEDGKLQKITTFALESYRQIETAETIGTKSAGESQKVSAPPSSRPRMVSILIDDLSSNPEDRFLRVTNAIQAFLENDIGPSDQVAIVSGSGRVQYPFSNDKQILRDEVATLRQKLNWNPERHTECPALTDLQAQRIKTNPDTADASMAVAVSEAMNCLNLPDEKTARAYVRMVAMRQYYQNDYYNRTQLRTFREHLRTLRHFDATKSALLFSDGFVYEDAPYELQDLIEEALRSGVILNTLNLRGLWGIYQGFDRGATADTLREKQTLYFQDIQIQENPLVQMAHETGGIYFHDNNDLHAGMQQISSRQDIYYVLTYTTPPHKAVGRYHSIKVEVLRPAVEVSYRKGYFAPKEEVSFERSKKEDILEALQAPGNLNEIRMNLSYNYYQEDEANYEVSFVMKVDLGRVHFLEEDSRHKNLISMIVAAFDENDRYISGLDKSVDFRLTDENYAGVRERGLTSKIEFKLPIGRYKIKAIVREAYEGKMGSLTKGIEIP